MAHARVQARTRRWGACCIHRDGGSRPFCASAVPALDLEFPVSSYDKTYAVNLRGGLNAWNVMEVAKAGSLSSARSVTGCRGGDRQPTRVFDGRSVPHVRGSRAPAVLISLAFDVERHEIDGGLNRRIDEVQRRRSDVDSRRAGREHSSTAQAAPKKVANSRLGRRHGKLAGGVAGNRRSTAPRKLDLVAHRRGGAVQLT